MPHTKWIWAPHPQSPPQSCPPATVDGSRILFGTTCTLIAFDGTVYQFDGAGPFQPPNAGQGNWEFAANGVPQGSAIALERNTGGQIYFLTSRGPASASFQIWALWTGSGAQAVLPSSGSVGNVFVNLTTAATYPTARAMFAAAAAGNILQIPLMPAGIPMWWDAGQASVANLTVQGVAGAIFGGAEVLNQGSIVALANGLTVKNLTLAYGNSGDPSSGVRQDSNFFGLTVSGCTIHDYDDGILTGPSTGGTTTVTNTTIFNCGDLSGSNAHGTTHNAYIGNEDAINVQQVTSYRTVSGGHCWKTRAKAGNIGTTNGCIFAQLGGDSTACIDIPCGGTYVVQNSILHRGPNAENNRFTTFGVEIPNPGACDLTGRSQSLIFDNCWFIDDGPLNSSATQVCQNLFSSTGIVALLRNGCRIVSNPNTSPVIFGSNVTDDGTTKHYASRAAAITAGENIPAAYSDSLACLPPIPGDALTNLLAGMTAGTWKSISQTLNGVAYGNVTTSNPNAAGSPDSATIAADIAGTTGPSAVTATWGGACFDTTAKRLLVWGGGHSDYHGNEVYAFNCPTLTWSRLTAPDDEVTLGYGGTSGILPNGNPASRHTYDGLIYLASTNTMRSVGGSGADTGTAGGAIVWDFNLSTLKWSQQGNINISGGVVTVAHVDPSSGILFAGPELGDFQWLNGNTWTNIDQSTGNASHQTGACKPGDRMFFVGNNTCYTAALSTTPIVGNGYTTHTTSGANGAGTPFATVYPGIQWHAGLGQFVLWPGGGGSGTAHLWFLDPTTFTFTDHAPNAANTVTPTAPMADGTFGRFQYLATYNCFILQNAITDPVFIYKPDF